MIAMILATLLAAANLVHVNHIPVLHGNPSIGESWVQGNDKVTVIKEVSPLADVQVKDLVSGKQFTMMAFVPDPDTGPGPFLSFDGVTVCRAGTTGALQFCNPITTQVVIQAATPLSLSNAGSNPTTLAMTANGATTVTVNNTTSTDGLILNIICPTAGNKEFDIQKNGSDNWKMLCNGNITYSSGNLTVSGGTITDSATGTGAVALTGNGGLLEETPTVGTNNILTITLPEYAMSASGVATLEGSTLHSIRGFCTFSASTTCTTSTQTGGAVWGMTFTVIGDMFCMVTPTASSGAVSISAYFTDHLTITAGSSNSSAVPYWCVGI